MGSSGPRVCPAAAPFPGFHRASCVSQYRVARTAIDAVPPRERTFGYPVAGYTTGDLPVFVHVPPTGRGIRGSRPLRSNRNWPSMRVNPRHRPREIPYPRRFEDGTIPFDTPYVAMRNDDRVAGRADRPNSIPGGETVLALLCDGDPGHSTNGKRGARRFENREPTRCRRSTPGRRGSSLPAVVILRDSPRRSRPLSVTSIHRTIAIAGRSESPGILSRIARSNSVHPGCRFSMASVR